MNAESSSRFSTVIYVLKSKYRKFIGKGLLDFRVSNSWEIFFEETRTILSLHDMRIFHVPLSIILQVFPLCTEN